MLRLLLTLALLFSLFGCGENYAKMVRQRNEIAQRAEDDIYVAAWEDAEQPGYLQGIRLAMAQINQSPEKLLGRNLRLIVESGGGGFDRERPAILQLARNPRLVAVLGHRTSSAATPASVIYEAAHLVFLPPFATQKRLTGHNFDYVFRMVPNNPTMAAQLASTADTLGYRRMVLLYTRDDYSRELAYLFDDEAIARGIKFASRTSFSASEDDYRAIVNRFASQKFDAVFLCAPTEAGARMARQLREMGVGVPILGSDSLIARAYARAAGAAGDGTIVPVVYRPRGTDSSERNFADAYKQAYGRDPDINAAQGYDSMRLLAQAIRVARTTQTSAVASTLHFLPYWTGVTGVHAFNAAGDLNGKKFFFQVLKDGNWHALDGIQLPFLLDALRAAGVADQRQVTDFSRAFGRKLAPQDLDSLQLDLAQELLRFKRLGLVLPGDEPSRQRVARARALGGVKNFSVDACFVAADGQQTAAIKNALLDCYGRLALKSDAVLTSSFAGVEPEFLGQLHVTLARYKVGAFMLGPSTQLPPGLALAIDRMNLDLRSGSGANLYADVLRNMKVFELAERMENMPLVKVNLPLLDELGVLHRSALLKLAPDAHLN